MGELWYQLSPHIRISLTLAVVYLLENGELVGGTHAPWSSNGGGTKIDFGGWFGMQGGRQIQKGEMRWIERIGRADAIAVISIQVP